MKLQAAMEYLFIVGVVMLLLIPVWVYSTTSQIQATSDLSLSYAQTAAEKLRSAADMVYSQGPPAKVTQNIFFPANIKQTLLLNRTIILKLETSSGISDIAAVSKATLTGYLPETEGNFLFTIESINDTYVNITYNL